MAALSSLASEADVSKPSEYPDVGPRKTPYQEFAGLDQWIKVNLIDRGCIDIECVYVNGIRFG
jgi:hypothetical protein